ncbi:MAG: single-stranded-DNA-specific exonuclease RecJ [Candidatus Roizmanbacteria bacterium]|nr:MAG: single-stranded-DNA-specific exonuclease RecJ [Candidatus Roizmanbacteria bacterium]
MKINFKKEIIDKKTTDEEIVNHILKDRGINNPYEFLNPPLPETIKITDFGFEKELKKTLKIFEEIKKENKTVIVYTDYDADGITGGAILWETLKLLGFTTHAYVPHRVNEGYGFSKAGIDNVNKLYHPSLIISVDHGITAKDKIEYAKSLGIKVVVTDHHLKPENLPECEAIFHIPELSGSGVAYFFAKAVFEHFAKNLGDADLRPLREHFQTDYLALASIGTIADLVPLVGQSRSIAKYGLKAFGKTKRNGINCIIKEAGIQDKPITPYEVGFIIAPRINAVGRLEHAIDALDLLCTEDKEKGTKLAQSVGRTNQERQELVKKAVEEARLRILDASARQAQELPKIITLVSDDWHEGIIGLIASKIAEEFYRPTIVMTKSGNFLKGSARSIPTFHVTDFLRSLKEHLIDVGGHTQAAGFTLEADKLKAFIEAINKTSHDLIKDKDLEKVMNADIKIPVSRISIRLAELIENLNPFGVGNPQPVFFSQVKVIDARIFGKNNDHLKIIVGDKDSQSFPLELIAFSKADDFNKLSPYQNIDIVYRIEIDRWNGNERLHGRLIYWQ